MNDAVAFTRAAILAAFQAELDVHADNLPELTHAKVTASIGPPHPTRDRPAPQPARGELSWPALVIETNWKPGHTGPLASCRQFIAGDQVAALLDCDLMTVGERELVKCAFFEEPCLDPEQAQDLPRHIRATPNGCAKCLELVNQVAAICTIPNQRMADDYDAQVVFNWTAEI